MFDLDDFKRINDRFNHLVGNAALAAVADRLREVLRGADVAARYGGDEFTVVLPEAGLEEAKRFYGRLREHVSQKDARAGRPDQPVVRDRRTRGPGELGHVPDADRRRAVPGEVAGKDQVAEAVSAARLLSGGDLNSAVSDIDPPTNGAQ